MEIKSDLPVVVSDNSEIYRQNLVCAIAHSDPEAKVALRKSGDVLIVHVEPSNPDFKQGIINDLLGIHHIFGIKIIFSKSLAISETVSFEVNLFEK